MSAHLPAAESDPRKERARATRRRMVEAAYRLFCERGLAVPLKAIAIEAQVAVQTLYFTFHSKVGLLREVLQYAVHGDDLPIPPHQRPWFAEMAAEPDPGRAIHLMLEGTQGVYDRIGPLVGVFKSGEGEISEMWERSELLRYRGMGLMVAALIGKRPLRPGVDQASVTDMVFVLLSAETYRAFVAHLGWSPERWREWTAATLVATIFVQEDRGA